MTDHGKIAAMNDIEKAALHQFDEYAKEIAALVAELMQARSEREGGAINASDTLEGASGLLAASYNMAKMAGTEHLDGWARIVRKHAEAIEQSGYPPCSSGGKIPV